MSLIKHKILIFSTFFWSSFQCLWSYFLSDFVRIVEMVPLPISRSCRLLCMVLGGWGWVLLKSQTPSIKRFLACAQQNQKNPPPRPGCTFSVLSVVITLYQKIFRSSIGNFIEYFRLGQVKSPRGDSWLQALLCEYTKLCCTGISSEHES